MAVYTDVSEREACALCERLGLGPLTALRGIQCGIENTNYFATTTRGEWVLTLFERLNATQLPFYLRLMQHLARAGIPVPDPQMDANGELLHTVAGKPAAMVNRLDGASVLAPEPAHCAAVGAMLARAHLATRNFDGTQPNLRGLPWWNVTAPEVLPHLNSGQAALLQDELQLQNALAASADYAALPRSAVHADLFRDNVMFANEPGTPRLTGFFDYYFAGVDSWLFDLAVALNDWAVNLEDGSMVADRAAALLDAYQSVRPLQAAEQRLFPVIQRAAALRFWISRLWDYYQPRAASLLQAHDPGHFERVLRARIAAPFRP